ncbi:MAG: hypothetical protein HGA96_17485 [Desulfobulbaceae bacterium]|nr:hypothetical protein [Desulfobulbaceae bacterium]
MSKKNSICFAVGLALLLLTGGCATVPYQYGMARAGDEAGAFLPAEAQIDRGRPAPFLDGAGHYVVSLPTKLMLLDWQVDNHQFSSDTEEVLAGYLADNHLDQVKVRVNQYAPGGEWLRLIRNREMPGFFKYTAGAIATAYYTIMPGRFFAGLFGGDEYNPYTNTINLYSDSPAIALHEAAHAKDFAAKERGFRGWYAVMGILPLVPLWHEAQASGDAIGYTIEKQKTAEEKEAYQVLYPAYSTYIAGEGLRWTQLEPWVSYAAQLAVTVPGHISGRLKAALVEDKAGERGKEEAAGK